MINVEISFRLRGLSERLSIPRACESFCNGCTLCGRCNVVGKIEVVSVSEMLIKWAVCVHSSNLSQYLLTVFDENPGSCEMMVGVKCSVFEEPEDELMYADVYVSSLLLLKMRAWRVKYFIVRARCFVAVDVTTEQSLTIDVDSSSHDVLRLFRFFELWGSCSRSLEEIAPDLWRLRIVDGLKRVRIASFLRMVCANVDKNGLRNDIKMSRRICITSRGCSMIRLSLNASMIDMLCLSAQTSIELIGVI